MRTYAFIAGIVAFAGSAMGQLSASGLVVLDPSGESALTMVGNSDVLIPARAVYVNSSSQNAVSTAGTAVLDCPNLYVVGGCSFIGHSRCTGHVTEGAPGYGDPLSATVFPTAQGMTQLPGQSPHGTVTLQPGYYAHGISVQGGAHVTLAPGVYLIGGSGLSVTAGDVIGTGVCIVMLEGSLNLGGNGTITLSPPTLGSMGGMVIGQPSTNHSNMSLAGGHNMTINGSIYAPTATLALVGTSSVNGQGPQMGDLVVANRVSLAGTALIQIGHPLSPALQLPTLPLFD
jgi:hypothetical protein